MQQSPPKAEEAAQEQAPIDAEVVTPEAEPKTPKTAWMRKTQRDTINALLPPSTDLAPPQQIELAIATYLGDNYEFDKLTAEQADKLIAGLEAEKADMEAAEDSSDQKLL